MLDQPVFESPILVESRRQVALLRMLRCMRGERCCFPPIGNATSKASKPGKGTRCNASCACSRDGQSLSKACSEDKPSLSANRDNCSLPCLSFAWRTALVAAACFRAKVRISLTAQPPARLNADGWPLPAARAGRSDGVSPDAAKASPGGAA